jgi:hypothetical protein
LATALSRAEKTARCKKGVRPAVWWRYIVTRDVLGNISNTTSFAPPVHARKLFFAKFAEAVVGFKRARVAILLFELSAELVSLFLFDRRRDDG